MRMNYPDPHPFKPLKLNTPHAWNHKKQIASREQYAAYMATQGLDGAGYDDWVARVHVVMANNAAIAAAKPAPVSPAPAAPASKPASVPNVAVEKDPEMPHQRARPKAAPFEVMSVRVRPGIGDRLDAYRAQYRASKQDVVSDILDDFLARHGF